MAWPKGVPRKKIIPQPDGSVVIETDKTIEEVSQGVTVNTRHKRTLVDPRFDPFNKWKTDEKHYHYRALNTNPKNLNIKEAEGWQIVDPKAVHGDLILGQMPRDDYEANAQLIQEKTKAQEVAAVEQFKEEAARHGVEVEHDVGT